MLLYVYLYISKLVLMAMVVCVWNACLRTSRRMCAVSATRRSSGVGPRGPVCAYVCM